MSRDLLRSSLVYQVNDQVYDGLERQVRVSSKIDHQLMSVLYSHQPDPYRNSEKGSLTASTADQAVLGGSRGFRPYDGDVVRDPSLEVQCTA
jgi:hypothetical protein